MRTYIAPSCHKAFISQNDPLRNGGAGHNGDIVTYLAIIADCTSNIKKAKATQFRIDGNCYLRKHDATFANWTR